MATLFLIAAEKIVNRLTGQRVEPGLGDQPSNLLGAIAWDLFRWVDSALNPVSRTPTWNLKEVVRNL
jgi:hypothetical protein